MRACHAQCSYCRDEFTLKYCRVWLNAPHHLITKTKDMGSIVSSPLKVGENIIFCYCKNIYKRIFLLLFPCWTDSPSTWEPEMFFSGNVCKAIGKRCNIVIIVLELSLFSISAEKQEMKWIGVAWRNCRS